LLDSLLQEIKMEEDLEFKKNFKISAIERRKDRLKEDIAKARNVETERGSERINEKVVEFYSSLDPQLIEIQELLDRAGQLDKTLVPAHLDQTLIKMNAAQKYITDSALFLPPYDMKNAQRSINEANNKFQDLQTEILPKKKFGFKSNRQKNKPEVAAVVIDDAAAVTDSAGDIAAQASTIKIDSGLSVTDKKNATIELTPDQASCADVNLANLENCSVHIRGTPSTLHIANIKDCRILCGPVSSSVFIEGCRQSKLVLSSQQLRIHSTRDTDFYIHVTAKAVIEDSQELRFGPNPLLDETPTEIWTASGLDKNINHWDKVGDFNWLAADRPSPNWSLLDQQAPWENSLQFLNMK